MERKNAYVLLGLDKGASVKELKAAYRKKARDVHPDKNPDDEDAQVKFQALKEAYDYLLDPQKRSTLDAELEAAELRLKRTRAVDAKRQNFAAKLAAREQQGATSRQFSNFSDAAPDCDLKRVRVQNLEFGRRFRAENRKGERDAPHNSRAGSSNTGTNSVSENFRDSNGSGCVGGGGKFSGSADAPVAQSLPQNFADLEANTMRLLQQMATAQNGGT